MTPEQRHAAAQLVGWSVTVGVVAGLWLLDLIGTDRAAR